jgi:CPA2 family monovalent cation:H+ antiporter-2
VAFTLLAGARLVPWLLERVAATRSRELFTLTVLVLALGIAVGSAVLFGVSMALGAFLAGMVVGRSEFSLRAASEALPMRDAFAVLFFVSVGMLFDPRQLWESPGLVLATLAIVVVGKPLAALGLVLLMKYPLKVALLVSVALAQIGEFSFILAAFGKDLGVLTGEATNVIVAVALVSITVNPILYRLAGSLGVRLARRRRRATATREGAAGAPAEGPAHRAVIVGYGPVGRTVTRLLSENGVSPTVIELNLDTVRRLRAEGVAAVYGDARLRETLESAGVGEAASLVLSGSGLAGSEEVARLARELNPGLRILARSAYVHELSMLRRAGADAVFSGEGEIALALTEAILRDLGATPEQIDRERERVHADLLGGRDGSRGAPQPG